MVEKKVETVVKLPPDMTTKLNDMTAELEKAEHSIEVLKKMGMETGPLEEKLEWSKHVRQTLLDEFS